MSPSFTIRNRIKAEGDHVLEDITLSVERTELGTVATSLRKYVALHGVARREALIGRENAELVGEGKGVAQPGMPLHDRKIGLRDHHLTIVDSQRKRPGSLIGNSTNNSSSETNGRVDQASAAQLTRVLGCRKPGTIEHLTGAACALSRHMKALPDRSG